MKFLAATITLILAVAFGLAAVFKLFTALKHAVTIHPFETMGDLAAVAIFGAIAYLWLYVAKIMLDKAHA